MRTSSHRIRPELDMTAATRHVADAGSYGPVTILIEETREGGTRVAYDSVASAIAPYHDATASEVARRLELSVHTVLLPRPGSPACQFR